MLGFSNLVADGISMGFGDFLSSSTEKDVAAEERLVTEWEVTNHSGAQHLELVRRYQDLGMDPQDATTVYISPWPPIFSFVFQYSFFQFSLHRKRAIERV